MGIFHLFKKEKPVREQKEKQVADQLIDYVVGLAKEKEYSKERIKEINKARRLPAEERDGAYVPIYVALEKIILVKKVTPTKEYFSRKILKRSKIFTREELRAQLREKFDIRKLDDRFKILFLGEPHQQLLLYGHMLQKFIEGVPSKTKKTVHAILLKETRKTVLRGITLKKGAFDFSAVHKKIEKKPMAGEEIITPFKALFGAVYDAVAQHRSKEVADEVIAGVYHFVERYGYPLNADALWVLPTVYLSEARAALGHRIVDYVSTLTQRKDLLRPLLEKVTDAEMVPAEEQETIYFSVYLELENFITEHEPPAVKSSYSADTLRKEVREEHPIQHLSHRFRLLFLEKEGQIIELVTVLYELYLKRAVSYWNVEDLQKFIGGQVKGTSLSDVEELVIDKHRLSFIISPFKVSEMPSSQRITLIRDLGALFLAVQRKTQEIAGEKKATGALVEAYTLIKEQYGMLPLFNDFVRALPQGILDHEKRVLLSPKAAEKVVQYLIEMLQKEKIGDELKAFEETKTLPVEGQSEAFFSVYLNLQNYIIDRRPSFKKKIITLSDVKERVRKRVNVRDLEDKFQLLFLREDETLVKLVGDLIKECVLNFIDKKALMEAVQEVSKKNRFLKATTITEEGLIDLDPFLNKIKNVKVDRTTLFNKTLMKMVAVVYEKAKSILGEIQAKKLFETAYTNLQEKYGANLLQVLKVIPKGILESEKFELLSKEQVEKTAKEFAKIDTIKGEFMNIAAHELKTPLVPIITYLEMLLNDKGLTKSQREKLRICLVSAKREADLVNDILDISKLDAGSMKFEFETVDMAELLREAALGLEPAVKQKKIWFKTDIPKKLPFIKGDKRRLTQVVTNLINNATKFTEKGGITVKAQKKEKYIQVSVVDTGIGISKENARKLFTKFFQVDSSARRKRGGTGLGLAICKGIVQGHHGKIWVEGVLGKGTTFFFTVPYLTQAKQKGKKGS